MFEFTGKLLVLKRRDPPAKGKKYVFFYRNIMSDNKCEDIIFCMSLPESIEEETSSAIKLQKGQRKAVRAISAQMGLTGSEP